jgi:hypothetical protein
MPESAAQSSCTPANAKYNKDSGANTVQGVPIGMFATDHVFEVHLISEFLEWLCNTGSKLSYATGPIAFPAGWGQPDATWCAAVFGGK